VHAESESAPFGESESRDLYFLMLKSSSMRFCSSCSLSLVGATGLPSFADCSSGFSASGSARLLRVFWHFYHHFIQINFLLFV
jgi:hypothetical protein